MDTAIETTIQQTIDELKMQYPDGGKVAIGLSGGVDSAVSAWLLKQAGFALHAVFLKCYPNTPGCRSEQDLQDAIKVASLLDVPLLTIDFIEEYRELVLEDFFTEYQEGRTPNPDILCNERIKFGLFFDKVMRETGADYFATGHYVRTRSKIEDQKSKSLLLRGIDESKDQSYFLYRVDPEVLERTIFPVGGLTKQLVRQIAIHANLVVASKHDSTGICFIGPVDLVEFLSERINVQPGNVVTKSADVVGTHRGVWFYTIGQRRGFETTLNKPLYVIGKDVARNELIVGDEEDLYVSSFDVNQLTQATLEGSLPTRVGVRVRNLGEIVPATVSLIDDGAHVQLEQQLRAVAPGQSAVFYDEDIVLGGGVISGQVL